MFRFVLALLLPHSPDFSPPTRFGFRKSCIVTRRYPLERGNILQLLPKLLLSISADFAFSIPSPFFVTYVPCLACSISVPLLLLAYICHPKVCSVPFFPHYAWFSFPSSEETLLNTYMYISKRRPHLLRNKTEAQSLVRPNDRVHRGSTSS